MSRSVLLLGATGQLGRELLARAAPLGPVLTPTRRELDLTDPASIEALLDATRPALVLNAAAYTAVDRAESEPALAHAVNALGPAALARACHRLGATLVHVSTDYVFGDDVRDPARHRRPSEASPYRHDDTPEPRLWREDDDANPLSVYGRTKLAGDRAVLDAVARGARAYVFRIGWVYAAPPAALAATSDSDAARARASTEPAPAPRGFFATIRHRAQLGQSMDVVADRFGSPTWAGAVAAAVVRALGTAHAPPGLYHLAARDGTTWYGFAQAIVDAFAPAYDPLGRAGPPRSEVRPTHSTEPPPGIARRPRVSRLDPSRFEATFGFGLASWREQLAACVATMPDADRSRRADH